MSAAETQSEVLHEPGLPEQPEAKKRDDVRRSVLGNLKWLTISTGLTTISTVVTNAVLARKIGASLFGEWAIVTATTSWILIIRAGIGSRLTRVASAGEDTAETLLAPSGILVAA